MADTGRPRVDPFADDIVEDPRRVDYSVPGLNEDVTEGIAAQVDTLRGPKIGGARKAMLILSPRAGFGKSHLIGMLFKQLSGRATLVNVRPFQDPETCWKSILMRMVQELDFPDRYTESGEATQLELFAHGVLSRVYAEYLKAENGKPETIEALSQPAEKLTWLKTNAGWRKALETRLGNSQSQWGGRMQQRFAEQGIRPCVNLKTWLNILYGYAYHEDWDVRQACREWLQGDPIDDQAARRVGIRAADRVSVEQTAGAKNELAKSRVMDLCLLAGLFRPFLICFDQTETYGQSGDLARTLGLVITDLTDEASNQLTVITANLDPWEKRLRVHWERASLDRLAKPLLLEGIKPTQARKLAEYRMQGLKREQRDRFWGNGQWLEELFQTATEMSVRMFLHACSKRWAEVFEHGPPPGGGERPTPLATLFQQYVDDISAKPRRLVYDRDTFYWLVSELASGVKGLSVDKVASSSREHLPRWRYGERQFIFGFESGAHWKRWHNIARSVLEGGKRQDCILVYPRTPDLPTIPKNTWRVARPDIERARRTRLLILTLDKHQLVRLYAAHEFHTDALQGDIDWQPQAVAEYLRGELSALWQSILEWPDKAESAQAKGPETPTRKATEPPPEALGSQGLQRAVGEIVRRRKFLSLEDLIAKLPGEPEREMVLEACGNVERIKVHTNPNKTVLQWRTTG